MDFETDLSGGDPRSLVGVAEAVERVIREPTCLEELYACLHSDDAVVRMRASDALEKVSRRDPSLLQPYADRVIDEMLGASQASLQWHGAQILASLALDDEQRDRARVALRRNLAATDDWIVTNLSLATLAEFARQQPSQTAELIDLLQRYEHSSYKSVASRVRKLLAEFES